MKRKGTKGRSESRGKVRTNGKNRRLKEMERKMGEYAERKSKRISNKK